MACLFNFSLKIILKSNQTFERPVKYASVLLQDYQQLQFREVLVSIRLISVYN